MIYPFIAVLSGIFLYAYYAEIVTIRISSKINTPEEVVALSPQPLTIVYPAGTALKSETKPFTQRITPQAVVEEWYHELSLQGLIEPQLSPLTIIHVGEKYCTLIWKKHPLAPTRSLCEHALLYNSLQETLRSAGYTYQGIYWCDESGPLEDPRIAYEQGIRGETQKTDSTTKTASHQATVVVHPYGTPDDKLRIDGEYPLTIARTLAEEIKRHLIELGIGAHVVEDQESLNISPEESIIVAVGAIKKSSAPYTICWYESASDMVRYSRKNLRIWIPAYEAAALGHEKSCALGKKLYNGLKQHRVMSFLAGGMPIAPLYGITKPAVALECCIGQKSDISLCSQEIATEISRILRIDEQKN